MCTKAFARTGPTFLTPGENAFVDISRRFSYRKRIGTSFTLLWGNKGRLPGATLPRSAGDLFQVEAGKAQRLYIWSPDSRLDVHSLEGEASRHWGGRKGGDLRLVLARL